MTDLPRAVMRDERDAPAEDGHAAGAQQHGDPGAGEHAEGAQREGSPGAQPQGSPDGRDLELEVEEAAQQGDNSEEGAKGKGKQKGKDKSKQDAELWDIHGHRVAYGNEAKAKAEYLGSHSASLG